MQGEGLGLGEAKLSSGVKGVRLRVFKLVFCNVRVVAKLFGGIKGVCLKRGIKLVFPNVRIVAKLLGGEEGVRLRRLFKLFFPDVRVVAKVTEGMVFDSCIAADVWEWNLFGEFTVEDSTHVLHWVDLGLL